MINRFTDQYFFLSNFYPIEVEYDGLVFLSSEAAFQAQKTEDPIQKIKFTKMSASESKKFGRKVQLRKDWLEVREQLMYEIVKAKFYQNPALKNLLLKTGDQELIEGNLWHDSFWGECSCQKCPVLGKNKLGKILMRIRLEFDV